MIEREDINGLSESSPELNPPQSFEEQEQNNSKELVDQLNDADQNDDTADHSVEEVEGTSDFLERSVPEATTNGDGREEQALSRNLKGDNPPGSEQAAFEAGLAGDMGAGQATYPAENIKENFRENLDKTTSEIELDKKLKKDA